MRMMMMRRETAQDSKGGALIIESEQPLPRFHVFEGVYGVGAAGGGIQDTTQRQREE